MSFRLEPSTRSGGMEIGLSARIHDALWLLARQWQLGEFHGQDAGTPALVSVAGNTTPIDAWRGPRQQEWTKLPLDEHPLDELIEREDESASPLRDRIEAGAHFQRLLAAAGLQGYALAFSAAHRWDAVGLADRAFSEDPLLAAVARRQPDGLALHASARALVAGQPVAVAIDAGDVAAVTSVAAEWLAWYEDEIAPPAGSGTAVTWQEHRLEYGVALSSGAAGGTVLTADAYLGDGLDWFDFEIDPALAAQATGHPTPVVARAVPTPVRYGGMPLPRFWAMEDARIDFGSIDAAPNDIGRLLLVEFATVFGNDWYILPLKLPLGSITLLDNVIVTDVFGRNLVTTRAGKDDPQWNLFSLSTKARGAQHAAQQALFLPPVSGYTLESSAVESSSFLRDEMADLAWAVETRVEDGLARRIDRRSRSVDEYAPAPGNPARPAYRVETRVPDYWLPLAPERLAEQSVRLRLVPLEVDDAGTPRAIAPQGKLLESHDSDGRLWLFEGEVAREGVVVDRLYRYARWLGGRSVLWTARRRRTGRGEGSSGLKWDLLDPA